MRQAFILVTLLAAIGPIAIPLALREGRLGTKAIYAFCLTNAITLSPMIGLFLRLRAFPPPPCRKLYPDAPCDGLSPEAGLMLVGFLFGLLALWGLTASSITTIIAFPKRR